MSGGQGIALNFNPQSVQPRAPSEAVPDGWYNGRFVASEPKRTKDDPNQWYLELEGEVTDGQFKGTHYWERLNLGNKNETAVEIAYRTLASICLACNWTQQLDHSARLHGLPHMVRLALVPAVLNPDNTVKYQPKNEPKDYAVPGARQAGPTGPAAGAPSFAPPAGGPPSFAPPGGNGGAPWGAAPAAAPQFAAPAVAAPQFAPPAAAPAGPTFSPPGAPAGAPWGGAAPAAVAPAAAAPGGDVPPWLRN